MSGFDAGVLEKLAKEAEQIGTTRVSATKIIMWAEDNGAYLADALRQLARLQDAPTIGNGGEVEAVAGELLAALEAVMAMRDRGFTKAVAKSLGLETQAAMSNTWIEIPYQRAREALTKARAILALPRPIGDGEVKRDSLSCISSDRAVDARTTAQHSDGES